MAIDEALSTQKTRKVTHPLKKNTANIYAHETQIFVLFCVVFQTTACMKCQVVLQIIHQTFEGPVTENILQDS